MNIFVYSDESGVFDKQHNDYYAYGGVVFLSKDAKDKGARTFSGAEKFIKVASGIRASDELKASLISNKHKYNLFRSMNEFYKFGIVIEQQQLNEQIFKSKKDKQRYLDYAFKIGVKRHFQLLIKAGIIKPDDVECIYFFVDEHTTATNGRYELRESLEQEFKHGTYNHNYSAFYAPIFPSVRIVDVSFCNSQSVTLVRAADIIANRMYYLRRNNLDCSCRMPNLCITVLP